MCVDKLVFTVNACGCVCSAHSISVTVGRRCSSFNYCSIHTSSIFYIIIDCINSWSCLMQRCDESLWQVFACMQHMFLMNHAVVFWFIFLKGIVSARLSALHLRPFFVRLLEVYVCIHVCLPLGVQVSDVSKAMLGQSSIVSSSDPLNSVGLVFEREGRCSTFH